jgi:hypothetical protein
MELNALLERLKMPHLGSGPCWSLRVRRVQECRHRTPRGLRLPMHGPVPETRIMTCAIPRAASLRFPISDQAIPINSSRLA